MPAAQSLRDLLRIRDANRQYIDSINRNLGSALGFKKRSDQPVTQEPAILIFVPRKVDAKWLPGGQLIRSELSGPDGLTCPVDVIEGGKEEPMRIWARRDGDDQDVLLDWDELRGHAELSESNIRLREKLRGWAERVTPGAQLAGFDLQGGGYFGTLGCFARVKNTTQLGFITNQHVADHIGNRLRFPVHDARPIGTVRETFEIVPDEQRLNGIVDEPLAFFRVDCAFAELDPDFSTDNIDPRLPVVQPGGGVEMHLLGAPLPLDLNTMGPIGREVVGVGRTRSFQRGTVAAFGYEWVDDVSQSHYTDLLIIGEDGEEFSDHGDSGKLIVTDDDDHRPLALLWGGWQERLRAGREQENWTYAIDINEVLRLLNVEIVSAL